MNEIMIAGVKLKLKTALEDNNLFEIHGLSTDEDRHHWVFNRRDLHDIGEWLIAFAGPLKSGDKADPRTWEIIVAGPAS